MPNLYTHQSGNIAKTYALMAGFLTIVALFCVISQKAVFAQGSQDFSVLLNEYPDPYVGPRVIEKGKKDELFFSFYLANQTSENIMITDLWVYLSSGLGVLLIEDVALWEHAEHMTPEFARTSQVGQMGEVRFGQMELEVGPFETKRMGISVTLSRATTSTGLTLLVDSTRIGGKTVESLAPLTLASALSNYVFAIVEPDLIITHPQRNEKLLPGSSYIIRWEVNDQSVPDVLDLKIWEGGWHIDTGDFFANSVISRVRSRDGYYLWNIPATLPPSDEYHLGLSMYDSVNGIYFNSEDRMFGIGGEPRSIPPIIYGMSGPGYISVGEQGAWTIEGTDDKSIGIKLQVDWEDGLSDVFALPDNGDFSDKVFTHSFSSSGEKIVRVKVTDLDGYSTTKNFRIIVSAATTPMNGNNCQYTDETLLRASDDTKIYVMERCKRRWIRNEYTFHQLGYSFARVVTIEPVQLQAIPEGESLISIPQIGYAPEVIRVDEEPELHYYLYKGYVVPIFKESLARQLGEIRITNKGELMRYRVARLLKTGESERIYYITYT